MYLENISDEKLLRNKKIKINVLDNKFDIYNDIARVMANTLKENNKKGKITSFILPVGPRGQYKRFARLCNIEQISCKNLISINMDEFLDEDGNYVPKSSPFSFRNFMEKNLFTQLDDKLKLKPENIYFPNPDNLKKLEDLIKELGGADICFSGVGINGHIAFNEPRDDIQIDDFLNLRTRVLEVSRDTILMTSLKYNGYIDIIPTKCITIGMKEIMASKKINIYLEHKHQSAALSKIVFGKSTTTFPITLVNKNSNTELFITKDVLEGVTSNKQGKGF